MDSSNEGGRGHARLDPGAIVAHRFVVESVAGSGGMGTVYRVRDRATGAPCALKVLRGGSRGRRSSRTELTRDTSIGLSPETRAKVEGVARWSLVALANANPSQFTAVYQVAEYLFAASILGLAEPKVELVIGPTDVPPAPPRPSRPAHHDLIDPFDPAHI